MSDEGVQGSLFGFPIVEDETLETPPIAFGERFPFVPTLVTTERVLPHPALHSRAAFVQYHVGEIVKKLKTVESHRSKAKAYLDKANATGDTGVAEEARLEYAMMERAQQLVAQHLAALTERTRIEP